MNVLERIMEAVQNMIDTALGVNLLDMVIQIAATLVLVVIVKIFFWGRITDFLEKRRNILNEEMESAKRENLEAQELKTKRETEYNQLRQESKAYLDEAKLKAEKEKERIILEAKTSAKSLMERGQKEIEAEKLKAQADLEEETLNLAALMAGKIIEKEVDPDKYQDLLVENLKRSEKS